MRRVLLLAPLAWALMTAAVPAMHHATDHTRAGPITVEKPWARATAPRAHAGAAFMTLTNAGPEADRLVAADAPVAEITELHTHIMDGGIARMRPVEAIEVPAGGSASLQPGGLHVMMIGLTQQLREGDVFPLTLTFESAGEITVDVTVQHIGFRGHGNGHSHH